MAEKTEKQTLIQGEKLCHVLAYSPGYWPAMFLKGMKLKGTTTLPRHPTTDAVPPKLLNWIPRITTSCSTPLGNTVNQHVVSLINI